MKKKLIKLREYWLTVSFTEASKTGDKDLIEAVGYLEKTATEMSVGTPIPFDYALSPPHVKRKWKLFFLEFIIISEKC